MFSGGEVKAITEANCATYPNKSQCEALVKQCREVATSECDSKNIDENRSAVRDALTDGDAVSQEARKKYDDIVTFLRKVVGGDGSAAPAAAAVEKHAAPVQPAPVEAETEKTTPDTTRGYGALSAVLSPIELITAGPGSAGGSFSDEQDCRFEGNCGGGGSNPSEGSVASSWMPGGGLALQGGLHIAGGLEIGADIELNYLKGNESFTPNVTAVDLLGQFGYSSRNDSVTGGFVGASLLAGARGVFVSDEKGKFVSDGITSVAAADYEDRWGLAMGIDVNGGYSWGDFALQAAVRSVSMIGALTSGKEDGIDISRSGGTYPLIPGEFKFGRLELTLGGRYDF